jgi:hypothetical protein
MLNMAPFLLISGVGALAALNVGFLIGQSHNRRRSWLAVTSVAVFVPWLMLLLALGIRAAGCPDCYDSGVEIERGEITRVSALQLAAWFWALPTVLALAALWVGAGAGALLRPRQHT